MNVHELRVQYETFWRPGYLEFIKILKARDCRVGVEVGVAFGGHAEAILEQTNVETLYGIDPYEHIEGYDDVLNLPQAGFESMFWYMAGRLSRFGRYVHIRERSAVAAQRAVGNCDFVYIDADHSYNGVLQDLTLWTPKVRDGGIIAGHDYGGEKTPGVKAAVDQFCKAYRLPLHIERHTVWWAEKTGFVPATG